MGETRDILRHNIVLLLEKNHITQKEFAEKLGVSQAAVTNWVKGKNSPDIEMIARICSLLNISITDLIRDNKQPIDTKQAQLLGYFEQLNDYGQEKLVEYACDLVTSGNYTNQIEKRA